MLFRDSDTAELIEGFVEVINSKVDEKLEGLAVPGPSVEKMLEGVVTSEELEGFEVSVINVVSGLKNDDELEETGVRVDPDDTEELEGL